MGHALQSGSARVARPRDALRTLTERVNEEGCIRTAGPVGLYAIAHLGRTDTTFFIWWMSGLDPSKEIWWMSGLDYPLSQRLSYFGRFPRVNGDPKGNEDHRQPDSNHKHFLPHINKPCRRPEVSTGNRSEDQGYACQAGMPPVTSYGGPARKRTDQNRQRQQEALPVVLRSGREIGRDRSERRAVDTGSAPRK